MAAFTTIASLALLGVGTGLSVAGQVKAGRAAKREGEAARRAAEAQAELLDYNAAVADLQAEDVIARGGEEESRFRQTIRATIGSQRAGIAAAGVDVGFGSAVDVQEDAAFLGELDALTLRTNAMREAWGYRVQAEDIRRRAQITRREGVQLEAAGRERQGAARLGAAGTLVGAGASLLEQRYGFSRFGDRERRAT